MPSKRRGGFNQAAGRPGERPRMSALAHTLTNASSLIKKASRSRQANGKHSEAMPSEPEGSPVSSSSSPAATSSSTSPRDDIPREGPCDIPYRVVLHSYGHFEKIESKSMVFLGRALESMFGPEGFSLYDELGRKIIFDSFADDGHHGTPHSHAVVIVDRKGRVHYPLEGNTERSS